MTMRPSYPKHDKSPPLTLKLTGRSPFDGLIVTIHGRDAAVTPAVRASGSVETTVEFAGQTLTLAGWAAHLGLSPNCLRQRFRKGWPIEHALSAGKRTGRCPRFAPPADNAEILAGAKVTI